jgi:hypothetical protein
MTIRYLIDEDMSPRWIKAIRRAHPEIDVLRVGDTSAPPLGTLDPAILLWCEQHERILITQDRTMMPQHLTDHHAAGYEHWGVLWVHEWASMGQVIEALYEIAAASEAEEWRNRAEWIPFS